MARHKVLVSFPDRETHERLKQAAGSGDFSTWLVDAGLRRLAVEQLAQAEPRAELAADLDRVIADLSRIRDQIDHPPRRPRKRPSPS